MSLNKLVRLSCTSSLLLLFSLQVSLAADDSSEDAEKEKKEVEEVLVVSTRLQQAITAIPQTVTVIQQERLEQSQLINDSLAGILEMNVPGYGPSQDKLVGRGETLRGRNPLYLIDGVPQHNPLRDSQRDGHHIDLDFVETVEVIHGSNSVQGIGATGGVINTITKSAKEDGVSHEFNIRMTSDGPFESNGLSEHLSYLGGYKTNTVATSLGVAYTNQDLYYDGNGNPVGLFPTQGDTMDSTTKSLFFKSIFSLSDNQRLQLMVNTFDLERQGSYVAVVGSRTLGRLVATVPGDPRPLVGLPAQNDVLTASLDYEVDNVGSWRIISQLYFQDFKGRFEGGTFGNFFRLTVDGPPFLDQSQVVSKKHGIKSLAHRNDLSEGRLGLTLGLDVTEDSTAQELALSGREWVPETKMSDVSPFVQLSYEVSERVNLNAGVRFERVQLEVDDYTTIASSGSTFVMGGKPDFDETLVNFGAVFHANDVWTLYASFSEGFTLPDVGRVLRDQRTPGADVDSLVNVSPVVTNNSEVGARYSKGAFDFDISFYQSKSDLGTRLEFNADGTNASVAREKTDISGFDVSANYAVNNRVNIGGNYAHLDARYDANGDGQVDTDLDGVNAAPDKLVLYLAANFAHNISARLDAIKLFSREFTGPGILPNRLGFIDFSDPYTLINLSAHMETGVGVFSMGIRNLLNEQYLAYYAQVDPAQSNSSFFAGRGRTLTLGYSRSF